MFDRWPNFIFRARWAFALIWIALTVACFALLPRLQFSFNLGQMLRGNDEQVSEVKQFYRTFPPSDGHLMVSASSDRPLTINDLRAAERWAEAYRALPEVRDVLSARLLLDLKMDGFTLDEWARLGGTGEEPLALGDGPGMATFKGQLISHDGKSAAIYIIKKRGVRSRDLHRAVESVKAVPWPGATVRVVGTDYLLEHMGGLLRSNFRSLMLYEILALALVVPFFMRSLRRAYLPFVVSWSALLFYLAIFILAGKEFGVMHLAGPGLIVIIGLADAIHLQQKFDDLRASGCDALQALRATFAAVGKACALTSLTTACGFLSLLTSRHDEVFDFGLWCAIGVVVAYLTVIIFLPVALVFLPGSGRASYSRSLVQPRILRRFAIPVTALLAILAAGIFRAKIDSSLERELPGDAEPVRHANWFAENFRGLDRIEIDLHADLRDPDVFSLVERMQNDLRTFPGISGSRSYVDAIRMTLAPEVVETPSGPMLGVTALGSGGAFPEQLLTRDLRRACVVFYRTRDFGTEAYEAFRERLGEYERQLPDGGHMKLSGNFPMFYESTTLISRTMVTSLVCSLAMITAVLIVVLRSFRLALIALVPNAIPLLVVAGISGWMGASLHLGILIVFSIGLGLAVDDTIHLMVRFQQLQRERRDGSLRELMDEAILSTGFAIVLTSVVLFVLAMCFLGSSFTTMRWTGLTLGIVAVSALLADLMILPWLVERFHRTPARVRIPASDSQLS